MERLRCFLDAVLAGMCVGLGGLVFLSVENRVLGAFLFTIGLFTICTMRLNLFTGKVCYSFERDAAYRLQLPLIWLGNLAGAVLPAFFAMATRIGAPLCEKAAALCGIKQADSLVSLFFLGLLCNICIYIGVESYGNIPHDTGKYLALVFAVMVFILCGTEHCVADMFYFTMAKAWCADTLLRLVVITAGNAAGGLLFPLLRGSHIKK